MLLRVSELSVGGLSACLSVFKYVGQSHLHFFTCEKVFHIHRDREPLFHENDLSNCVITAVAGSVCYRHTGLVLTHDYCFIFVSYEIVTFIVFNLPVRSAFSSRIRLLSVSLFT